MGLTPQLLEYEQDVLKNQKQIREMVLESYYDIALGKGREVNEFFDELEKRYLDGSV